MTIVITLPDYMVVDNSTDGYDDSNNGTLAPLPDLMVYDFYHSGWCKCWVFFVQVFTGGKSFRLFTFKVSQI